MILLNILKNKIFITFLILCLIWLPIFRFLTTKPLKHSSAKRDKILYDFRMKYYNKLNNFHNTFWDKVENILARPVEILDDKMEALEEKVEGRIK